MKIETKACTKCGSFFPITKEFFAVQKKTKSGLSTECRNCLRIRDKEYKQKNKAKLYKKSREYRKNNPDWLKQVKKNYYQRNRQTIIEKSRRYRAEKPNYWVITKEKTAQKNRRRRAFLQNANGSHSAKDIETLQFLQKRRCYYCSIKISKKYHIDHIVPLSRGGSDDISNLCIACVSCNLQKGTKLIGEWIPFNPLFPLA